MTNSKYLSNVFFNITTDLSFSCRFFMFTQSVCYTGICIFFLSVTIGFIVLTACVILLIFVPLLILLMRNSSPSFLKQRCSSSRPLSEVTEKLCEDGETNYSVQTDGYAKIGSA